MTTTAVNDVLRERLVDAREAAHCLNLQLYLLTHPKERDRLQVPHYRVGKLVRFKLGELMVWMEAQQAVAATGDEEVVDA
ncbi:MAG TPA: DNA-binding protein [Burkholderiaceae bacterium]|nr:DNA-binding protein [Burkholderiaceae bacterium]